jgi:hypothetical protein
MPPCRSTALSIIANIVPNRVAQAISTKLLLIFHFGESCDGS